MNNWTTEERFNIKPKMIVKPLEKGFCNHCISKQKDHYCHALDTSCDKVYICRSYLYTRNPSK